MKLKTLDRAALLAAALGLACYAAALSFLPDTVPAHYNFAGEIDRMGSKYEYLVFPAIALLSCGIFLLLAHRSKEPLRQKVFAGVGLFELVFFFILGFYTILLAWNHTEPIFSYQFSWKLSTILIGLLLVFLGNCMPKARRNAIFGLRVSWTMDSDVVWQRSQRFAGITAVASGAVLLVLSIFLSGPWPFLAMVVVLTAWVTASLIRSYQYHLDEMKKS